MKIITLEHMDRGLAYAESCFETFRVIDGAIFDWAGHWLRLQGGLAEFGVHVPLGQDEEILFACLREAAKLDSDVLVRLTISGGQANWGLTARAVDPAVYIQCMPYSANNSPDFLRLRSWPFPLKQKSAKTASDYADTLRALKGAADANVLFEKDGLLLATATANILLYRNDHWFTPSAEAGVLPGRVRALLIKNALVVEQSCPVSWLTDCEAAAVCNSGLFIRPVAFIADIERLDAMDAHHVSFQPMMDLLRQQEGVQL